MKKPNNTNIIKNSHHKYSILKYGEEEPFPDNIECNKCTQIDIKKIVNAWKTQTK